MAARKLKVAMAGLDSFFFSQMFAKHLQANPAAELVGCATLGVGEEEIADNQGVPPEQFAREFGVPVYEDVDTLLGDTGAEAVCVTTRPSAIPHLVKRLAERGIHVYAAKPVAGSEEGLAVLESVTPGSTVLCAGPTARFDPALRQAQERVSRGDIGDVTSIRVMHQHGMLKFWPNRSWYYDPKEGGIEYFLAWYCFDLIRWFTGGEIESLQGFAANRTDRGSPHADMLKAIGRMSDGTLASLDVLFNVSWNYPMFEVEVIGTKGAIRVQQDVHEGKLFSASGVSSFGNRMYDSLPDELDDWVKACLGERKAAVAWMDAVAAVRAAAGLHRRLSAP